MMNGDDSCSGLFKPRSVLGDVTNQNGKRGLPLNPGIFVRGNGNGCLKNGDGKAAKDDFLCRVSCGVENLDKGKENVGRALIVSEKVADGIDKGLADGIDKGFPFSKVKRACHSVNSDIGVESTQDTIVLDGIKEIPSSSNVDLQFRRGDTLMHGIMEGEGSRDSCISSISVPAQRDKAMESSTALEQESQDDSMMVNADTTRNAIGIDDVKEALVAFGKNEKGKYVVGDGQFLAPSGGSYECVDSQVNSMGTDAVPSQESLNKSSLIGPSVSKTSNVKLDVRCSSDGVLNTNDGLGSEKTCSCSFCMKAAYLWSDLHYQDTKGRLAALNKSRKEVKLLLARNYNHDDIQRVARESFNKTTKLEFNLMNQWKSLFIHTDDVLVREITQLQPNLFRLKELREQCEKDLDFDKKAHSDKP